ncbi:MULTISPECIES: MFS transporter [Actinomyces]|uniref:MFS transporter n=1 Tax=Actinomyces respiraculi TaxID=2744574 RepID=A0A7T0LJ68_9ACTO|nr:MULTISPECIES: MFS transporter [Actinomyces]QPL04717.1 MFS transporter [Actinomyces respiraculi]
MQLATYFTSFAFSLFGNSIANVVLPVLVLVSTGEALSAGLVALASGASTFVFGLLSGPLIDRYDRRLLASAGDLVSASSIGLLATVGTFGELSLTWFIISAFLSGIGDMPAWNAREAMIYGVQRHSRVALQTLVGVRETVSALAIVLGPTFAGLLMNFFDARLVLWVTAATSLIAGTLCLAAPRAYGRMDKSEGESSKITYWTSFRDGIVFLGRSKNAVLRALTGLNVASVMLVSILQGLLIPVFMTLRDVGYANGPALAAVGLGLLSGGVIYALVGTKVHAWPLTLGASLLNVVGLVLLVQFYSVIYTIVMCFFFGLSSAAVGAVTGVVSLQVTPEEMRGRINGLQNSFSMVIGPLGIFLTAWLISGTSVTSAGWALVIFWMIVNALFLLNKRVRRAVQESQ